MDLIQLLRNIDKIIWKMIEAALRIVQKMVKILGVQYKHSKTVFFGELTQHMHFYLSLIYF